MKIKPCPFCGAAFELGSAIYLKDDPTKKLARCSNNDCWAHMPACHYEESKLIRLLNKREQHNIGQI